MGRGQDITATAEAPTPSPDGAALMGRPAAREVVPRDPLQSVRWHRHDYPSPIARWNAHPEYEIHLITRSRGRFIIGDVVGRFEPGQLVLIGPEVPHHWISDLESEMVLEGRDVVLQFHEEWIRGCRRLLPELASLDSMLEGSVRGIEFSGDTAARGAALLESFGEVVGAARIGRLFELLALLADAPELEHSYLARPWVPVMDAATSRIIDPALEYIFSNLQQDVRLAQAARLANMSESAFSRFFKKASGRTFSEMIRSLRLSQACSVLENTGAPVSDVASTAGYRNLSNFNRQFLAEMGCTPSEYRRRHRTQR